MSPDVYFNAGKYERWRGAEIQGYICRCLTLELTVFDLPSYPHIFCLCRPNLDAKFVDSEAADPWAPELAQSSPRAALESPPLRIWAAAARPDIEACVMSPRRMCKHRC